MEDDETRRRLTRALLAIILISIYHDASISSSVLLWTAMTAPTLNYSGHLHFRHRLVLAILSGKTIKIDKIRPGDKNPGLRGMLSEYSFRGGHY